MKGLKYNMRNIPDEQIQMRGMFHPDAELKTAFRKMESVENLNYDPMAVRVGGFEAARRSYLLGFRDAESQLVKLLEAFDKWYCDSGHMCELCDKVKGGTATADEVHELESLTSLLNVSINCQMLSPAPEVQS